MLKLLEIILNFKFWLLIGSSCVLVYRAAWLTLNILRDIHFRLTSYPQKTLWNEHGVYSYLLHTTVTRLTEGQIYPNPHALFCWAGLYPQTTSTWWSTMKHANSSTTNPMRELKMVTWYYRFLSRQAPRLPFHGELCFPLYGSVLFTVLTKLGRT